MKPLCTTASVSHLDYKTTVTIKPVKAVVRERLGMPILLSSTGGTARLPSPKPRDRLYSIDGTGLLGLFSVPKGKGTDFWLLASWFWLTDTTEVGPHNLALVEEDPHHKCRWLERSVRMKSLWDRDRHKMVEVYVNKHTMTELFEPFGGPFAEAKWLAGRLMPRRLSAALRLHGDYHIQLWVKL